MTIPGARILLFITGAFRTRVLDHIGEKPVEALPLKSIDQRIVGAIKFGDSDAHLIRILVRVGQFFAALALFDRLKVKRRWRILEIGPGQGSLHMELRRRLRGPVDAVEPSSAFADALRRRSRRDGFGDGALWHCNLIDAPLPPAAYDLIFARWVFLFLPDPEAHLQKLVSALKPGGRLAIEDYSRWTLRMVPEPPEWDNFLKADGAFFESQGGDVNIGARLPLLYAADTNSR